MFCRVEKVTISTVCDVSFLTLGKFTLYSSLLSFGSPFSLYLLFNLYLHTLSHSVLWAQNFSPRRPGNVSSQISPYNSTLLCPDTRLIFFQFKYSQTEPSFMSQVKSYSHNRIIDIVYKSPDCTLTQVLHLCQILQEAAHKTVH